MAERTVLLDVLPILGKLSRTAVGIAAFLVSLVLTAAAVLLSRLIHNPLLLTLFLAAAAGFWLYRRRRLRPAA